MDKLTQKNPVMQPGLQWIVFFCDRWTIAPRNNEGEVGLEVQMVRCLRRFNKFRPPTRLIILCWAWSCRVGLAPSDDKTYSKLNDSSRLSALPTYLDSLHASLWGCLVTVVHGDMQSGFQLVAFSCKDLEIHSKEPFPDVVPPSFRGRQYCPVFSAEPSCEILQGSMLISTLGIFRPGWVPSVFVI